MKFLATTATALLSAMTTHATSFNRVATWFVCSQMDPDCNIDDETAAETIWVTKDLNTLVYSDSLANRVGFIDITDPSAPMGKGYVDVPGEPTTVRVHGDYAVVGVNTSPDFVNPSGILSVIDVSTMTVVQEIDVMGQPDAVDVSPDEQYIALAIENERDEDLGDGRTPQMPAGFFVIIDTPAGSMPADWTVRKIELTGLDILYPEDPEPEYLHINENNVAVVTLQENNGIAVIDLPTGSISYSFKAGKVALDQIDIVEEGIITQTETGPYLREPDGVTWIGTEYYATANEGDMDGGSRGFTIFNAADGSVTYDSNNEMELWVARVGHYPEARSESKGNEPKNIMYSEWDDGSKYLFVLSERSSLIFVYDCADPLAPSLLQLLPSTKGPEGMVSIPSRNLLAVAAEEDSRGDKMRSSVAIYELSDMDPMYPSIISDARDDGSFIPFAALSGLASASPYGLGIEGDENMLYTIEDSFFQKNRVLTIDTSSFPAVITQEMRIMDSNNALKECLEVLNKSPGIDISSFINDDMTVNIDPEGIAVAHHGGFWLVSEGSGTEGDKERPFASPNILLHLDENAIITKCVTLPDTFPDQVRFGFEGVAENGDYVVVVVQRAWGEDHPRIAVYNQESDAWKYAYYPLDAVESQYGGWIGLSDIAPVGNGNFLVLERDNQGGPDAAVKRIYQINLGDFMWEDGAVLEKVLVKDIMEDLMMTKGSIIEKVEGLTVTSSGSMWINTDNDGVDDNSGEQVLMHIGEFMMKNVEAPPSNLPPPETDDEAPVEDDDGETSSDDSSSDDFSGRAQTVGITFVAAVLVTFC